MLIEERTIQPSDSTARAFWTGGAIVLQVSVMLDAVATLHRSYGFYPFNGGNLNPVECDQPISSICSPTSVCCLDQPNDRPKATVTGTVVKMKVKMMIQMETDDFQVDRGFPLYFCRTLLSFSIFSICNKPISL